MSYATLGQLKEYLGITGATEDALLTRLLDAASAAIDARCGRRFVATTATKLLTRERIVGDAFLLPDDLLTLTSVVTDEGDTLLPAHFVSFSAPTRTLRARHDAPAWGVKYTATVTGVWGYSSTVTHDIVQACVRLVGWMYRSKDAQVFDVTGQVTVNATAVSSRLPTDVVQLLTPYVALEASVW